MLVEKVITLHMKIAQIDSQIRGKNNLQLKMHIVDIFILKIIFVSVPFRSKEIVLIQVQRRYCILLMMYPVLIGKA